MEETNRHIDQLITDYLTGSLDEPSMAELRAWVAEKEEHARYLAHRREVWFSAMNVDALHEKYDAVQAFERFRRRVARHRQPSRGLSLPFGWKYAASVAVVIALSVLAYWWGGREVEGRFADITVEAPWGSRTRLTLPDGSLVWLNAGSRMTYSQGFGVSGREVKLEGEGYFEVAHNEDIPFYVATKELRLKVLGTKFNFRDYPDDREAVVSLLEGRVGLDNLIAPGTPTRLSPDHRAVLCKADGVMKVEQVRASNATEWTEGYLFFDEKLLPDIARELEWSYNVQIHLADSSLNSFRFYGNFVRREQTIAEVMEVLASTGKIDYEVQGRDIVVSATGFQQNAE